MERSSGFVELPKELFLCIAAQLDVADRCRCTQVSKKWRNVFTDDACWKDIGAHLQIESSVGAVYATIRNFFRPFIEYRSAAQAMKLRQNENGIWSLDTIEFSKYRISRYIVPLIQYWIGLFGLEGALPEASNVVLKGIKKLLLPSSDPARKNWHIDALRNLAPQPRYPELLQCIREMDRTGLAKMIEFQMQRYIAL